MCLSFPQSHPLGGCLQSHSHALLVNSHFSELPRKIPFPFLPPSSALGILSLTLQASFCFWSPFPATWLLLWHTADLHVDATQNVNGMLLECLFSSPFSSFKRLPRFASTLLWDSFCPTLIKLSSSLKTKFGSWLPLILSSIPHPPPPISEDQLPTPTSYGYNGSTLSRTPQAGNERTTAEHRNVILLHSLMCYKP